MAALLVADSVFSSCVLPAAVTAAKPAHSSAAANADAAAPGADAAEIEAVRLAALASMNKQAGGAPDALGLASKQAAGVTPMLRLRPTVVQQVCEASTVPILCFRHNCLAYCRSIMWFLDFHSSQSSSSPWLQLHAV